MRQYGDVMRYEKSVKQNCNPLRGTMYVPKSPHSMLYNTYVLFKSSIILPINKIFTRRLYQWKIKDFKISPMKLGRAR